jgi:hypothetical protein
MARDGLFVKDEIETGRNKGQVENTKGVPTGEKGIKSSDRESTEKGEVKSGTSNLSGLLIGLLMV